MRATLEIPDPLFREVKARAAQSGLKLEELEGSRNEVAAGKNAFCDFVPVCSPNGVLGEQAFMAFEQIFSGASHPDKIGARITFG